ncbi:UDP-glucose 4-epimerase GalE [Treponema phagedenis]|uniref:UDP-glucose 4-epimerase n=1 Tax=Treponema phagedenis TaxID=162 RepID=A0AAE6IVK3_TREPH|nr:UDP-glucose 4-epimerase GalE [Treponema phagedenis]QEJ99170.1 UDP-glucose 4-epimerase GalE [Treponema phagedenis]QEK00202.1 UDP-glucose 4-epimerase GalE [Treponema phagedenis]QEK04698.1 UDP-glucose 4-epimerase GalE [Treponema phagedenis]QEK07696.1 UDP-glucose 4-epimerase GalE [Treponema phagedenis]QEK10356.1 UDP-glucose 4-epimerase GalE [Treponema phagedenis]
MRVLVIGGAGYIGSHVVKAMLKAGHAVTVFDNLSSGMLCNLFDDAEFIAGDCRHADDIEAAFARGFDGAVYLAAFKAVGESMEKPEKYSINNISATMNILNTAVKYGCLRFVFSSSAAVYGSPQYLPIDEKHPKNPESYYGFTKLKTEEFLQWYDRLKNLKFASLRYFNAAGYDPEGDVPGLEKNPQNLLPIIMETAAGMRKELQIFGSDYDTRDGTCIRDYVHVSDLAEAHVNALQYIDAKNESLIVNLGSETGITVTEMLEAARKITGKEIPARYVGRRAGDPAELYATSARARETIGWNPRYSDVDTLIESTWRMYQKAAKK